MGRYPQKKLTPEGIIKRDVKYWLQMKGWFIFPIVQGLGAYKGVSDFYVIKDGRGIWMEIKTPKGKQSDYQIRFQENIESSGGEYMVIRSLDELIDRGF